MTTCLDRLQQRFREAGVPFEVVTHPYAVTTQEAAAATRVSGYLMAKSVVVMVEGQPHLCVLPAASTVDLDAIAAPMGAIDVRLAREEEFDHLFPDCDAGALPPLALSAGLPVHIDRSLLQNDSIVFEAGSSTEAIRMRTEDYLRVAQGDLMQFAESPRGKGRQRPRGAPFDWRGWGMRGVAAAGALAAIVFGPRVLGRLLPNRTSRSFAAGATAGVAAAVLADPRSGARRRAIVRDKSGRYIRRTGSWLGRKGRYSRGKIRGIQHTVRETLPWSDGAHRGHNGEQADSYQTGAAAHN